MTSDTVMTSDTLKTIHVTTPCRLHFGLFSFGQRDRRQFGGVGAMFDRPGLQLKVQPASTFSTAGLLAERIATYADSWARHYQLVEKPSCLIRLESAPPMHVGLGVGTQLGLAVAIGLARFTHRGAILPAELASSVGRGQRSAVGTFGFVHGGLIAEKGKANGERLSPMLDRVPIPNAWRAVLITQRNQTGLHGRPEREAFAGVSPVPLTVTEKLLDELVHSMLPALRERQFDAFCESVFRYGRTAGDCFASIQGGPYNGPALQHLVERLRSIGIRGVGQTSWGPTLFALQSSQAGAEALVEQVGAWPELAAAQIVIAQPNNVGCTIREE